MPSSRLPDLVVSLLSVASLTDSPFYVWSLLRWILFALLLLSSFGISMFTRSMYSLNVLCNLLYIYLSNQVNNWKHILMFTLFVLASRDSQEGKGMLVDCFTVYNLQRINVPTFCLYHHLTCLPGWWLRVRGCPLACHQRHRWSGWHHHWGITAEVEWWFNTSLLS